MEETTMIARIVFGFIVMMFVLVQTGNAGGKDNIQKYFNDTACKVKATDRPGSKSVKYSTNHYKPCPKRWTEFKARR